MCVPQEDLTAAFVGMSYLTGIQRGKLIKEIRALWDAFGIAPPELGAPTRVRPPPVSPDLAGGRPRRLSKPRLHQPCRLR